MPLSGGKQAKNAEMAAPTEWSAVTGIRKPEETAVHFIITKSDDMAYFQDLTRDIHAHRKSYCGYVCGRTGWGSSQRGHPCTA